MVSGAVRFGYANAIWVGPQVHGDKQQNTADDGIIRVVYLEDVLFVRRSPDSKSVDSAKADGGATLADGE